MSDTTPNLALPYILAAQSQKHVTHNEAIRMADALVQIAVLDRNASTPPTTPANGDRYIVAAAPTGAWAGQANAIAAWQDGAWAFFAPRAGWLAWIVDESALAVWTGSAWVPAIGSLDMLGINATADANNRLAVSSPATLLNHAGAGHQLKINKAAAGDTASLLFQTGFSGRAEIGTTGDDKLHVKVSANGASWREALTIDPATGYVGIGTATPASQLDIAGAAAALGYSMPSDYGLSWGGGGAWITGNNAASFFRFMTANTERLRIDATGTTHPGADNAYTLGTSSFRWASVWAANGTIQTSDARDKNIAARLDGLQAVAAVDAIAPVMFRWKVGSNRLVPSQTETEPDWLGRPVPKMVAEPQPGTRLHAGFIAQEVKAAMDAAGVDFGVWGLDDAADPDSRQWLRPDQMIPVLWAALKETRAEVAALRARLPSA